MHPTLQYIMHEVTTNPKAGIAVENVMTGNWESFFSTNEQLKADGFETVHAYITDIIARTGSNINVYLKRRSGSSSVYVKDADKQRIVVPIKPTKSTNMDVSKNVETAPVVNSTGAATLSKHPVTPTATMENPQQQPQYQGGLFGAMDPMQAIEVFTNHKQYESASQELQAVKAELLIVKAENERFKFDNYKLESKLELQGDKRPFVSDKFGEMIMENAPILFEKISGKQAGLSGAAEQQQFSPVKTTMLGMVKSPRFEDNLCQLFIDINNKIAATPKLAPELQALIKQS